jgi:NTE family protein
VAFVSTVSGGSLGTGLVYTLAEGRWPACERYLTTVVPGAKRVMTTVNLQRDALFRLLWPPWRLPSRGWANVLSESLQHRWQVRGLVNEVPNEPRWIINATAYESGKNWRFAPRRMGDYVSGYVRDPKVPIADAMAASAGYPILIGFLALNTADYEWVRYAEGSTNRTEHLEPEARRVHLWDGGVYDNLGVEPLFKPGRGLREGLNFLLVSDASGAVETENRYRIYRQARRLLSIAMDQVRSLRARTILGHFEEYPRSGAYLMMGNTASRILKDVGLSPHEVAAASASYMPDADVRAAAQFSTTLRRLQEFEFDMLYRHGWECANYTLSSYHPAVFSSISMR